MNTAGEWFDEQGRCGENSRAELYRLTSLVAEGSEGASNRQRRLSHRHCEPGGLLGTYHRPDADINNDIAQQSTESGFPLEGAGP